MNDGYRSVVMDYGEMLMKVKKKEMLKYPELDSGQHDTELGLRLKDEKKRY